MRVLVCGSRAWMDWSVIYRELTFLTDPRVIEGGARGADRIAKRLAEALRCHERTYPADWNRYGYAAGPIRNRQMLVEGRPDFVLAFRADGISRGTDNMIEQAEQAKVPVKVIR